jgi:catechol-2,3-dioxygenase
MHEVKNDAQTITAYFVDDPAGNAIELSADDPDRDYMRLRIGTLMQLQNGMAGLSTKTHSWPIVNGVITLSVWD